MHTRQPSKTGGKFLLTMKGDIKEATGDHEVTASAFLSSLLNKTSATTLLNCVVEYRDLSAPDFINGSFHGQLPTHFFPGRITLENGFVQAPDTRAKRGIILVRLK